MGKQSDALFQRAQEIIPGGVNSPVRAFRGVGGTPPFIEQGQGSRLFDADNLQYIDCVGSWGPMILGHGHRFVVEAVKRAATRGFSFGAPTVGEVELAEMIIAAMPSIEMIRLVNSGTEAAMSALRLARAATGRAKVLKFDGGYHGHVDSLLVKAGSGGATFNNPDSAGVPAEVTKLTVSVPYNDLEAVRAAMDADIAAIIVEPVAGNPVAVAAGRATLGVLKNSSIYADLEERGAEFEKGVKAAAEKHNVAVTMNRVGSMWTIFFNDGPVTDFESANRSNREKFARFFHLMLGEGVYLPPSQLEAAFFSAAHAKKDIVQMIQRVDRVLKKIAWEFEK